MIDLDKYSQKIADYIYNDMDVDERLAFEQEMIENQELAREYLFQLKMVDHIKTKFNLADPIDVSDLAEAESLVKNHQKKHPEDFVVTDEDRAKYRALLSGGGKSGSVWRILYPLVTAAAVFVVGLIFFKDFVSTDQGGRLYNKYYTPLDDAGIVTRSMEGSNFKTLNEALDLYRNRKYIMASSLFAEITQDQPGIEEAILFLGLSRMGEENYDEAAKVLSDYLSGYNKYQIEASWYLSLCYLKTGQAQNAIPLLQDLTGVYGSLGRDASKLLKRLKYAD